MFEQRWLAMLIAIGAIFIARVVITIGGISLINLFQSRPLGMNYQAVLVWGGLRGSVSLALALSIPCLLYTSPSPRDATLSRMPSSA